MASLIGDTGIYVEGAIRASGVAAAAGVAGALWFANWGDGGHVRSFRRTHAARGRAPYMEWSIASGDFSNEVMQAGGLARLQIKLAAVVRNSSHGLAEQQSANMLLTALDSIRLLPGGFSGAGDSMEEMVKIPGFSDLWRREALIQVALDFDYAARALDPGVVSIPGSAWAYVNFTDTGGISIPMNSGAIIDTIRIEPQVAWDGVGAALTVYADPDPVAFFTLPQQQLNDMTTAQEARGPFAGCTAVRCVPTPGTGAVGGKVRVYVYSH